MAGTRHGSTSRRLRFVSAAFVACCLLEGTSFVGNGSLPMLPKLPKSRALSQTQLAATPSQRVAYAAVVQVQVKEGQEENFLEGEPLNQRFDVLQQRAWMSDQFEVGLQSLNPVLAHPVCDSLM